MSNLNYKNIAGSGQEVLQKTDRRSRHWRCPHKMQPEKRQSFEQVAERLHAVQISNCEVRQHH